jgi:succinate dehydrogenase / fumarate reductase, cytochrome b subunit
VRLNSSIGRKMILAAAGIVWTGFVFVHMAGNLLILFSAEAYNKYAHAIVSNKILLYGTEAILVSALLVHAILGIKLSLENRSARDRKYIVSAKNKKGTLASKTIVLAFIIYHLITFKYGAEYLITYDGVEMRDLHRLVVEIFKNPIYVFGYVICLALLGVHLSHGTSSVFQTLGFSNPNYTPTIKKIGVVYALVVVGGFIAQPIYVFFVLN